MQTKSAQTLYREKSQSIRERIEQGKGLTKIQARATVALLEELLEKEATLDKEMEGWRTAFEIEQTLYTKLAQEWNALTGWLCTRFGLKVYSEPEYVSGRSKKDIWTVEYPGGKLTGYETMWEAFQTGIEQVVKD